MAYTEEAITSWCLLFKLMHEDVEGLGDVREDPSKDDGANVFEGEGEAG